MEKFRKVCTTCKLKRPLVEENKNKKKWEGINLGLRNLKNSEKVGTVVLKNWERNEINLEVFRERVAQRRGDDERKKILRAEEKCYKDLWKEELVKRLACEDIIAEMRILCETSAEELRKNVIIENNYDYNVGKRNGTGENESTIIQGINNLKGFEIESAKDVIEELERKLKNVNVYEKMTEGMVAELDSSLDPQIVNLIKVFEKRVTILENEKSLFLSLLDSQRNYFKKFIKQFDKERSEEIYNLISIGHCEIAHKIAIQTHIDEISNYTSFLQCQASILEEVNTEII